MHDPETVRIRVFSLPNVPGRVKFIREALYKARDGTEASPSAPFICSVASPSMEFQPRSAFCCGRFRTCLVGIYVRSQPFGGGREG